MGVASSNHWSMALKSTLTSPLSGAPGPERLSAKTKAWSVDLAPEARVYL